VVEICVALLSNASLKCCDDQVSSCDSISFVQQVPCVDGQLDSGTPEN
jgi:hypothetical protein